MLGRWPERIVGDEQVSFPRGMEDASLKNPAVRYPSVIGQPNVARGELDKAVVTLKDGQSRGSESLLKLYLAPFTGQPASARLAVISDMPKTATGKMEALCFRLENKRLNKLLAKPLIRPP